MRRIFDGKMPRCLSLPILRGVSTSTGPSEASSSTAGSGSEWKRKALSGYDDRGYPVNAVEQIPVHGCYRQNEELDGAGQPEREGHRSDLPNEQHDASDGEADLDPLTRNVRNIDRNTYQVTWYADEMHPARRFLYWSFRKVRLLPPDWQDYYRRLLRQEIRACRYVTVTWDSFMMIVEGYRKVKWILRKYEIPFDEKEIPEPYGNFWEQTTHEERLWAHRRSFQLKEMQAVQREDDEIVFGAMTKNVTDVVGGRAHMAQGSQQYGTPSHSQDMPAPREMDVRTTQADEDMSSALFSSVEDDKLWNPVLKQRLLKAATRAEAELYAFEDEDEVENDGGKK